MALSLIFHSDINTPVILKVSLLLPLEAPKAGQFDTRIAYQPHPNRGKSVSVEVITGDKTIQMNSIVNMTQKPALKTAFIRSEKSP